jgi:hypothetical protein
MTNPVYTIIKKWKSQSTESTHSASKSAHAEWLACVVEQGNPLSDYNDQSVIISTNKYDDGYTYSLSSPVGEFNRDRFNPVFSPQEMLALGVFEGKYLNDDILEYPLEWFTNAKVSLLLSDPTVNCMTGSVSRQPLSTWANNGWLCTDKKGWFQWYCRYYLGRRLGAEDDHQMARWRQFNRHAGQIRARCTPGDLTQRPVQRQALLQWSYNYAM